MVCTGNICRSPTAEAVLRSKLARAGLGNRVLVDSAGTLGIHAGEPPDARSQRHARERGYDLSPLRARQLVAEDLQRFHWLLGMDEGHLAYLQEMAPASNSAKLGLLLQHAPNFADEREVPDPYYGPPAAFERVLDLVEDACDGLVARLTLDLGTS
jgi:protein-tyrosine phosphatase